MRGRAVTESLALNRSCRLVGLGIGGVLVASGAVHLANPYHFLSAVYSYDLVGPTIGVIVAAVIPWAEFGLGTLLVSGRCYRAAAACGAMLTALFFAVQVSAVVRGLPISCGCFGPLGNAHVSVWTSATPLALCGAASVVFWLGPADRSRTDREAS